MSGRPKLSPGRLAILQALTRGDKVVGQIADPGSLREARAVRKRSGHVYKLRPSDVDALCRLDLADMNFEGMGTYTLVLTEAGRAALRESGEDQ